MIQNLQYPNPSCVVNLLSSCDHMHQSSCDVTTQFSTRQPLQVAQLWQRNRATLALFSINVQLCSQSNKIAFSSHPEGIYALYLKV